jgi:hypothetical protein
MHVAGTDERAGAVLEQEAARRPRGRRIDSVHDRSLYRNIGEPIHAWSDADGIALGDERAVAEAGVRT